MTALNGPKQWSPEQLRFMAWLATPESERRPRFQRDLAGILGVHETTLSEWKRIPGFGQAVLSMAVELVKATDVARIVNAQVEKALAGDLGAARFVLDFVGGWPASAAAAQETPQSPQVAASAMAISVSVTGAEVDEDTARRLGARKLLRQFTVAGAAVDAAAG